MTALALVNVQPGHDQSDGLWSLIDAKLLSTLKWGDDQVLTFPQDNSVLGWAGCKVAGCEKDGRPCGGICASCDKRWKESGILALEDWLATAVPRDRATRIELCAVKDCRRPWKSAPLLVCDAHHWQRVRLRVSLADFLVHPRVSPYPAFGPCEVVACTRDCAGVSPHCKAHHWRATTLARQDPQFDPKAWAQTAPAIPEVGKASLRGLPLLLISEVLYGIQERARKGSRVHYFVVRNLCDKARLHAAESLADIPPGALSIEQEKLRSYLVTATRRAIATPEAERHKDTWDLAIFGLGGTLTFTEIS